MKKKIYSLVVICCVSMTAVLFCYNDKEFNNLFVANVEALAEWETPATGTCCPEDGSYCCVGPHAIPNYYYKSEGPCNEYE